MKNAKRDIELIKRIFIMLSIVIQKEKTDKQGELMEKKDIKNRKFKKEKKENK